VQEALIEARLHRQRETGPVRRAEEQEPQARVRHRDRGLEHFPQHRLHVEVPGEADRHVVQPPQVLDLHLELVLHRPERGLDRVALGHLGLEREGLLLERDDGPEPRLLVDGPRRAGRNDARVPRADLHDRVHERVASEIGEGIRAEQLEGAGRAQIAPELLEADGHVGPPARQQEPDHLAEHAERPIGSEPAEEGADRLREAPRIDVPGDLDAGQGIGGIDGHVLAGGLCPREVQPRAPQPLLERVPVILGRDHEARLAGRQAGAHVVGESGDQDRVVVIELDDVVDDGRSRRSAGHERYPQGATHVPGGPPVSATPV